MQNDTNLLEASIFERVCDRRKIASTPKQRAHYFFLLFGYVLFDLRWLLNSLIETSKYLVFFNQKKNVCINMRR